MQDFMSAIPSVKNQQKITKVSAIDKFALGILFLFMSTGNLYLLPSGTPQISHYLLFTGVITLIFARFLEGRLIWERAGAVAFIFGMFTFFINMIYFIFIPDRIFLLSSFFYVFDALVFIFIIMLFRSYPKKTLNLIYIGLCISIFTEVVAVLFFPEVYGGRANGTFNNPNQLAYWTIFTASILILVRAHTGLRWYDLALLIILLWLQTVALSKAGLISYLILLLGLLFYRVIPAAYRLTFGAISVFVVILIVFNISFVANTARQFDNISNAIDRLEGIGNEKDDSLRYRGYYRPLEYPQYLLTGAGEGGYHRFFDMTHDEIHSGLVNIIFSYGIFGFLIFLSFLYYVTRRAPPVFLLILCVITLNGLTHQNVRFTYFWITMAVAYGVYWVRVEDKENQSQSAGPINEFISPTVEADKAVAKTTI